MGAAAAVLALAVLAERPAAAQFGGFGVTLPKDDFTWTWGRREDAVSQRFPDFTAKGGEGGFTCDLNGKLRFSAGFTTSDARDLQNQISSSGFFVEAAANAMNSLDLQNELEWAMLDCKKHKETAEEAEKRKASLQKLHDKEVQKLIKRREKREREAAKQQQDDSATSTR